eukprot:scaffold7737_cov71-Skeletonema_dohrnii-CCMP3373.AAC.5
MNPEADRSEIRRQIVESCPDVSDGALKIAMNGLDVKWIHEVAARIRRLHPNADLSEIRRQIVESCQDVSEGARKFAMNGLHVKLISNDLARAKKEVEVADDGRQVDLNEFFEQASLNYPNNKGAISFVKDSSDLRNLSSELKRAKKEAVGELDTEEFLDQFLKTNPDKHVAIRRHRACNSILTRKRRSSST